MKALIARLEMAMEPAHELDAAIYACCGEIPERLKPLGDVRMWAEGETVFWKGGTVTQGPVFKGVGRYPNYTASIDAALTLLPPWSWRAGNLPSGRGFADLGTQESMQCIEGATPAIALCIAALKARSTANAS